MREELELKRREVAYRSNRPPLDVEGLTVILVDGGLATGATMRVALKALRGQKPKGIIIVVPTASVEVCDEFGTQVDDIVCGMTPTPFYAVGAWYEDFPQTTDEEVRQLIKSPER